MRTTRQKSKAPMESPMGHANPQVQIPEEEEPQESAGESAVVVAVNGAAAAVEITVRIAKARLHCPVCTLPLKPPIFHCAFGHLACGACHLQLTGSGAGRCYVCGDGGGYARGTAMEDIVKSAKVLCPHDAYGCRSYVTYYEADEHQRARPHAPCLCSEPGCGFAGTPAALRDHLSAAHSWPVDGIRYGAKLQLRVPESDPAQHWRLLAAGDDEGGEVFFLAVGAIRDRPFRVVSLVCARPGAAAAAGPRYACTIRAAQPSDAGEGSAESVVLEMAPVPSSAAPGATSIEEAASLVVLRRTLPPGAAPGEMHLTVRIDRIV
ncbi:E3 ubiquitin-protein ligase SINA-like 5 [Miscanthus floridulus]|uniref:E3 ubiquitin-protein ligase SINA-like 5 n=1 Tax=Miscanthus floridulus TaxID=154761 RepID=UPI003457D6D0